MKRFRNIVIPLTTLVLSLATRTNGQTTLLSNGPYATNAGWNITNFSVAQAFTVTTPLTFNGVRIWSSDFTNGGLQNFEGGITWRLYGNGSNNRPGELIRQEFSSAVLAENTGSYFVGTQSNIFQLTIPTADITLTQGTYWLSPREGSPTGINNTPLLWMEAQQRDSSPFRFDYEPMQPVRWDSDGGQINMAVELIYDPRVRTTLDSVETPEPNTLALAATGAAGAAIALLRRRNKGRAKR